MVTPMSRIKQLYAKLTKREKNIFICSFFWMIYSLIAGNIHWFSHDWSFQDIDKMYTAISLIGLVAIFAFIYWLFCMFKYTFNNEPSVTRVVKVCTASTLMIIIGLIAQPRTYGSLYTTADTSQVPQQDVVYLTYSTTCEFCIISEDTTVGAIDRYVIATGERVQLVDIDQDNPLANELRNHIRGKGSLVKLHGNDITTIVYTQGDGKGNPVKAPTETIYRYIQEVSRSGR